MAINVFRNVARSITAAGETVYTAPSGYSGIVLMAQVSNTSTSPAEVSMFVIDTDSTQTSLLTDFEIPGNDAAGALTGKLVLEAGQSVFVSASTDGPLQLVMSILESQN